MPKIDRHPAGAFCWFELGTTDQEGAKSFYSKLFGWVATDSQMGPGEYYTMFSLDGSNVAAAYTMRADERSTTPPHWGLYVAVDSAEDSVKRAGETGGRVLMQPFDVMTFGRMAVIQDPTGAVFSLWQSGDHTGTTLERENGTMCWADLSTPDPGRAKEFYEGLFGWTIGPAHNYPPDYLIIRNGERKIGGIPPAAHRNPSAPPHWMLFFHVANADAAAAKAKELGGAEHMAPMSAGGSRLAILADPQGAAFAVIQPPA